jgi:hypothetical protein
MLALLLCAGACAAVTTGCGSITHVTRTITRTAAAATTPGAGTSASTPTGTTGTAGATTSSTTATTASASQVTGRSPHEILTLAVHALQNADGYAMRADLTQNHQRTVIDETTTGPRTFNAALDTGAKDTSIVRIGSATYLKGNAAFWDTQAGHSAAGKARARQLAGRWISVPAASRTSVNGSLGTLGPQEFARCLREDHGTLTIAGHATVDGQAAVIVRDAGNAPGSTPSTLAVAATGTPYPLRYVATGDARRGGKVDVCNTGKGGGAIGTITLNQFGQIAPIQRPTGVSSADGATI